MANQAARAGAQAVEVGGVRAGRVGLDPRTAAEVANQFVAATGHRGSAVAGGTTVVVTVDITVDLPLLSAAGLSSTTVTGRGSARIVRGISEAER